MESATPGVKTTPDGWLNRLLGALPAEGRQDAVMRAVSVGAVLPRIFAGRHPVANIASGRAAARPTVLDRPRAGDAFARLYGGDDAISRAYRESVRSHREVMSALGGDDDLEREMQAANNGAPLPERFPADAARLARLMRRDARVQLAHRLAPLGDGLSRLATELGAALDDTVVIVMSEFGRTVHENGNRGTDHGHGNVMWLLGGRVAGGKVHGRWPGLADGALYQQRDLAVTTDFRQVLAQVCERHLALPDAGLAEVFPRLPPGDDSGLALLRV